MTANDRWIRIYSVVLGVVVLSPIVMIGTRIMQVGREERLGFPPPTGLIRHALGRRLDDVSWWVQVAAATGFVVIFVALLRIRRDYPARWSELRLWPNWIWTGWAAFLTMFYIVQVFFQDTGNAFFYEFALPTEHPEACMNDALMRALQSWEGWHNVLMIWLATLLFPAAWSLLRLAKNSDDCDPSGRIAAAACLNAGVAPVTMLVLFQIYRAVYISAWLGEEAKLYKNLGIVLGPAAMAVQVLPLIVLFVLGLFCYGFKSRFCLKLGNIVDDGIEWVERKTDRARIDVVRKASPAIGLLRYIDMAAVGLWWTASASCPCINKTQRRRAQIPPEVPADEPRV